MLCVRGIDLARSTAAEPDMFPCAAFFDVVAAVVGESSFYPPNKTKLRSSSRDLRLTAKPLLVG